MINWIKLRRGGVIKLHSKKLTLGNYIIKKDTIKSISYYVRKYIYSNKGSIFGFGEAILFFSKKENIGTY